MIDEQTIDEATVPEAVRILVLDGVIMSEAKMRHQINTLKIKARKVGRDWFVPRSELDRIRKAETRT